MRDPVLLFIYLFIHHLFLSLQALDTHGPQSSYHLSVTTILAFLFFPLTVHFSKGNSAHNPSGYGVLTGPGSQGL